MEIEGEGNGNEEELKEKDLEEGKNGDELF